MTVVDASAVVEMLLAHHAAEQVRESIAGGALAPDLLDAEALHTLVGHEKRGEMSAERVRVALDVLMAAPIARVPNRELVKEAWRRSAALSGYDALYVALAETTGSVLMTADARLARAPGLRVPVTLVPGG